MANGHGGSRPNTGGARKGAGGPKKQRTEIRDKALEEAGGDAKYALGLIVMYMHDKKQTARFRRECASEVMDRVWCKPTQRNVNENSGELVIQVNHVERPYYRDRPSRFASSTEACAQ